ncbi:MAG: peptidoglycan editing factor PgeF [Devosia sp.]
MSAPYTTSQVLADDRLVHGFFGREGGRSMGELAGNNMSIAQGDNPDLVVSNRSSAAYAMDGHGIADLVVFRQVHSTTVVTLTQRPKPGVAVEADAMVTNRADLLLGILTADCSPVLLADPEAGIVGAAHAGWKGAAGGIVTKTVAAMVALGARPERIRAAIGPTISAANYEIGPDTAAQIAALDAAASAEIAIPAGKSREHFDIPGFLQQQLFTAGVGLVGDLALCTYADPGRYFSHRYATHHGINTGRQIAIIGRREA